VVKAITTNNVHNSARIKHSAPILLARILEVTMVNRRWYKVSPGLVANQPVRLAQGPFPAVYSEQPDGGED
jgi:hypothetical protein